MEMKDLTDKIVRISATTITAVTETGKTAGMITGVGTFFNAQYVRERLDLNDQAIKLGISRFKINWHRLFLVKWVWYYLVDDRQWYRAKEFQCIDGDKPIRRLEDGLWAAERFGATIIHVASITDGRRIP